MANSFFQHLYSIEGDLVGTLPSLDFFPLFSRVEMSMLEAKVTRGKPNKLYLAWLVKGTVYK